MEPGSVALRLLHPAVQHHLRRSLNWLDLWPVQRGAVEPVLDGEDVLLCVDPGRGRLEALFLPLLSRMLSEAWSGTSTLFLAARSTRSSSASVIERFEALGELVGRTIAGLERGVAQPASDVLLLEAEAWDRALHEGGARLAGSLADLRLLVIEDLESFVDGEGGTRRLEQLARWEQASAHGLQRIGFCRPGAEADRLLLALSPAGRSGVVVTE